MKLIKYSEIMIEVEMIEETIATETIKEIIQIPIEEKNQIKKEAPQEIEIESNYVVDWIVLV